MSLTGDAAKFGYRTCAIPPDNLRFPPKADETPLVQKPFSYTRPICFILPDDANTSQRAQPLLRDDRRTGPVAIAAIGTIWNHSRHSRADRAAARRRFRRPKRRFRVQSDGSGAQSDGIGEFLPRTL